MKTTIVFLLVAVALTAAVYQQTPQNIKLPGDQFSVERQKDILYLFKYIQQPSFYQPFTSVPYNYPVLNEQLYVKPQIVQEFFELYDYGFLPKGEIFSIYYPQQREQAIALYKLFYYAKDFDSFFNTAVWARQYINEQMFVYIFSVALVHRPDTQQYTTPPIYEIFPQFFFSSDVIQQAYMYKQMMPSTQSYSQGPVITANYSGDYLYLNKEQSISYFTEDIGLNAFFYYYNVYYPFWLDQSESSYQEFTQGGIYYIAIFQQFLAKYYLERLSNGLGHIPFLDIESPYIHTGFYSSLTYPNGLQFPTRPDGAHLIGPVYVSPTPFNVNYTLSYPIFKSYARRINDAIDLGYVFSRTGEKVPITGASGLQILTDIILGTPSSLNPRYYGSLLNYAKYIYGYSYVPYDGNKTLPSVLEQPQTAIRDPMFYQIYKWLNFYFQHYISYQPYYTYQDLVLPGVKVQSFEIDRLVTYFDYYYVDISNALYVTQNEFNQDNVLIKVRQQRLNHKPFQYKFDVQSSQVEDVIVKLFIGPKYDEINNEVSIYENYWNFVLLDYFPYTLQVGQNLVERDSKQSPYYFPDQTTYKDLYSGIFKGYQQSSTYYSGGDLNIELPNRFMLPKGTPNGQYFTLYLIVVPAQVQASQEANIISQSLFPMDKFAEMYAYEVPNAIAKDAVVYFKNYETLINYTV